MVKKNSFFREIQRENLGEKPARCFISSRDWSLLRFERYLLRFHLASDWSRNNKHSRNFLWRSRFYGKDCNCEKQSLLTVELKNLTTKQSKNSLACGFDPAFLRIFFESLRNSWAVVNAEEKLVNPSHVALTKIPRNKGKIFQKTDFLSSEEHLLTSPGCCLT